jgi:hypothetical protein
MAAKGIMAALNLSSGYHTPLRFLRHLITMKSETRPTIATPTVMEEGYGPSNGRDLRQTHASETCRQITCTN